MLLSTFIEKMNFVGSGNSNGRIDRHIGNSNSNDLLIVLLKFTDFSFRKEAHDRYKFKYS